MFVVTGGAGFIGSNVVRGLNRAGIDDIIVVDDLTDGTKFRNLVGADIADFWDKDEFRARLKQGLPFTPDAVLHQGACAVTTEWNGRYMMDVNYRYSVELLERCLADGVPLIYASSAAVYGASRTFREHDAAAERPLNVYGYSKLLFDAYVRRRLDTAASQIAGFRYFNVYGPGEAHKGPMASVAFHLQQQLEQQGELELFEGSDGYAAGEQRRDFVYVDDVVDVNLWFLEHRDRSGIFNVGTGASASFNDLANALIDHAGRGRIRYIPFPEHLVGRYQSFTEADVTRLREAGYDRELRDVEAGIGAYVGASSAEP